jgi:hypothetical protein
MSSEDIRQAETNSEAALLAIADAREAERAVLLWQKPFLADAKVPDVLGISATLRQTIKSESGGPPFSKSAFGPSA